MTISTKKNNCQHTTPIYLHALCIHLRNHHFPHFNRRSVNFKDPLLKMQK